MADPIAASAGVAPRDTPGRATPRQVRCAGDMSSADTLEELRRGVVDELKLHAAYAARWGVDLSGVEPIEPCAAYVAFLRESVAHAAAAAGVAAMVPCMRLYAHLGQSLAAAAREAGSPTRAGPYQEWVDTYSASDFEALAASIEALLDRLASAGGQCGAPLRTLCLELYRRAMELELGFFEAWSDDCSEPT